MIRKQTTALIFCIAIIMLTIVCCEYEHPVPIEFEGTVSYKIQIQPIFDVGCNGSGCHSTGAVPPDLTAANSYNSLFANNMIDTLNPTDSDLYKTLNSGSMRPYLSNTSDASLILRWLEQGAKNN